VIFVPEWPKFYWLHSVDNHVSVLLKQGCRFLSIVFQVIQSLNLNYGKALIWQISVSQASMRQFPNSRKILRNLQLSKSQIPSWLSEWTSGSVRTPFSSRSYWTAQHRQYEPSGHYSMFEKILKYALDTDWWRQLATVRTLSLIWKRVKRVMEVDCSLLFGRSMPTSGLHPKNSKSELN